MRYNLEGRYTHTHTEAKKQTDTQVVKLTERMGNA